MGDCSEGREPVKAIPLSTVPGPVERWRGCLAIRRASVTVEKTILASVEGGSQTRVKRASVDKKKKTVRVDKYLENLCKEEKAWVIS